MMIMSTLALFVLGFIVAYGVSYYPGAFFRYLHSGAAACMGLVDFLMGLVLAGFAAFAAGAFFTWLVRAVSSSVLESTGFTFALIFTEFVSIVCVLVSMSNAYERIRPATRFTLLAPEHPGSTWIETHYKELRAQQWVAADADGILAFDCRVEVVLARLQDLGLNGEHVALAFLE
jgi:hypothetical protein